jgi:hypothetical protein
VEGADATPTTQAVAAAAKIERELDGLLRRWADTRTARVAALNNLLRQAALPALDPSKLPGPDAKVPEAAHHDED